MYRRSCLPFVYSLTSMTTILQDLFPLCLHQARTPGACKVRPLYHDSSYRVPPHAPDPNSPQVFSPALVMKLCPSARGLRHKALPTFPHNILHASSHALAEHTACHTLSAQKRRDEVSVFCFGDERHWERHADIGWHGTCCRSPSDNDSLHG